MTLDLPADHDRHVDQFFERIRAICPSYVAVDDAGADAWRVQDTTLPHVRIAGLAQHMTTLARERRLGQVQHVLDEVERVLMSPDDCLHVLMVVGFYEDFSNDLLGTEGRVSLVDIRARLGPLSMRAWDQVMEFWHGTRAEARRTLPPDSVPDDA